MTKKAGIIPFILSDRTWRDEKHLSLRAFTESQKLRAYERQGHKCPLCVANGINTEYAFEDMEVKQGNEYLGLLTESQKASIKRFRSLRSIATAHPFNTSRGGNEDFGRGGTEWFVDIHPYGWHDDFLSESNYGFCEDESFDCSEKPDFVMIVYSANNDSRHRRKIYIYKDIIEPLIMSVEFLNKEIKKQNHAP